jgi:2-deoxy-D-gluconate 3-dehydrogenase
MTELPGMFDLTGKVALVTGCQHGVGLAIARVLAQAGADIIGVSASIPAGGGDAARQVEATGRAFTGYRVDLAYRAAALHLTMTLNRLDREIDILVSNAGPACHSPTSDPRDEDWDRALAVNLSSPFVLARELGKRMLTRGNGKIIFVASSPGSQGEVPMPGYTAAQAGLAGLTKVLAGEWASRGINVNAIAAGRAGRPEDLAGAAIFLASPASDRVHGAVIPVDAAGGVGEPTGPAGRTPA